MLRQPPSMAEVKENPHQTLLLPFLVLQLHHHHLRLQVLLLLPLLRRSHLPLLLLPPFQRYLLSMAKNDEL